MKSTYKVIKQLRCTNWNDEDYFAIRYKIMWPSHITVLSDEPNNTLRAYMAVSAIGHVIGKTMKIVNCNVYHRSYTRTFRLSNTEYHQIFGHVFDKPFIGFFSLFFKMYWALFWSVSSRPIILLHILLSTPWKWSVIILINICVNH